MALERLKRKVELPEKRLFCNYIYYNDNSGSGTKIRKEFCRVLAQYKHIDCPGRSMNNMSGAILSRYGGNWWSSKMNFIKNYKFTIAFENSSAPGYVTEKLRQPLYANSIPIYWGAPDVALDFNPKAFINCHDFANFDEVIEYVKYLDNNDDAYLEMLNQPPMNPDFDYEADRLDDFLINIIEHGTPQAKDPRGVWSSHYHYNLALNKLKQDILQPIIINSCSKPKEILDSIGFATMRTTNLKAITAQITTNLYSQEALSQYFALAAANQDMGRQKAQVLKSINARICKGTGRLFFCADRELANTYRQLFKLLWPHEIEGLQKARIGGSGDGGYVMLNPDDGGVAFSCGAGHSAWDNEMTKHNYFVLNFYANELKNITENAKVYFIKRNLISTQSTNINNVSVHDVLRKFENVAGIKSLILQMDTEGWEWDFFDNIDTVHMLKFSQIMGEFHGMTKKDNLPRYKKIFEKILETHVPIHFHYNNYGPIICFEEFLVSNLFEITFARRDIGKFTPSLASYPTDLDYPNLANVPEVYIGKFDVISAVNA